MLSKCANPPCDAKFQYLRVGKLFVIKARRRCEASSAKSSQIHQPTRYFWLCARCSQSLTIQASGFGQVRIAQVQASAANGDGRVSVQESGVSGNELGCPMQDAKTKLDVLRKELEFLQHGGYRNDIGLEAPSGFRRFHLYVRRRLMRHVRTKDAY